MEEIDPQIRVARLDRLVNVFDVGDVKGARDAEDGQNDRLVFLVDENLEFFDLGLFREERSRFVSDGGLFRFFFCFRHVTVEKTGLGFRVHSLRQFLERGGGIDE